MRLTAHEREWLALLDAWGFAVICEPGYFTPWASWMNRAHRDPAGLFEGGAFHDPTFWWDSRWWS